MDNTTKLPKVILPTEFLELIAKASETAQGLEREAAEAHRRAMEFKRLWCAGLSPWPR